MASDKRITRAVDSSELADLLRDPPRAIAAINSGGLVSATPVAFRLEAESYWIGFPHGELRPALGQIVTVVIDDGQHYFDIRGIRIRGRVAEAGAPPGKPAAALNWIRTTPEKITAWHYGTLREAKPDGP